jgi:branched-chain amino acid transport system substrate-binding protein
MREVLVEVAAAVPSGGLRDEKGSAAETAAATTEIPGRLPRGSLLDPSGGADLHRGVRKTSFFLSLAAIVALTVTLVGCQKSGTSVPASDTIKIGLAGAQTGPDGQIGLSMLNGSKIAIDEWNAKGGVLGKKIEVISIDDEAKPDKAVTVAQTLIDAGVVAVVGHFNSGCTIPASQHYNDAKIIEISPGSTNPKYTDQGFPYAFRVCGRDDQQGATIATYLHDQLKLSKIAILDDKTTYGEGLANVVNDAFKAKGGTVVMFQGIGKDDLDFRSNISVLKDSGAEAFVWGGMYNQGGPLFVQLRQAGLTLPFISDDGCFDQAFINTVGKDAGNVFLSFGKDYHGLPAAQSFMQKYKDAFHQDEGSYSVYGYDAANVLLTAIDKAQSTDADKVAAVLKGQPFDTILGKIEFDQKGDLKEAGYVIWTIKDGKFQQLPANP